MIFFNKNKIKKFNLEVDNLILDLTKIFCKIEFLYFCQDLKEEISLNDLDETSEDTLENTLEENVIKDETETLYEKIWKLCIDWDSKNNYLSKRNKKLSRKFIKITKTLRNLIFHCYDLEKIILLINLLIEYKCKKNNSNRFSLKGKQNFDFNYLYNYLCETKKINLFKDNINNKIDDACIFLFNEENFKKEFDFEKYWNSIVNLLYLFLGKDIIGYFYYEFPFLKN